LAGSLGTPRQEFLESVRQALGREAGPPDELYHRLEQTLPDLEAQAGEIRRRVAENGAALLDRLAEVASLRGWRVYRSSNPEEAVEYIGTVAQRLPGDRVVRSDQEVFHQLPVDVALTGRGLSITVMANSLQQPHDEERIPISRKHREEAAAAGLGITGADYAVAETGSVILLPRRGISRLVSLLPPVHIALVRPQDLLESLDDLFLLRRLDYHRHGGEMGSYLNFITGPSRTGDIEQTLIEGVHGPGEVHMVLLG
jgi:L-lactate dehydrogenase complex protein LldG